jgi:hypothetical protein
MPTRPLTDLPGPGTGDVGSLADVTARLDVESPQRGDGLRATLTLGNEGPTPVQLVNPFDLLQWQLLDERGAALDVPSRAPNLRVHRPGPLPWKLDSAVPIIEVRHGRRATDPASLDVAALDLVPDAELAVTYELDRPSGDYRLGCLTNLIDAADPQRSRIIRCDPLPVSFTRA